jgi:ring-1,2-phenylacetyl-CoA epoxidase subunit PaaE
VIELSFSGRINSDFVKDYTMNNSSTIGTSQHFICGPSQMKEMIIESLVNRGLPRESVFSEDFQLTINEQDLIEVIDSEAELHVNGKEFNVLVQRGKTILDAYLDNGIDLPYSCQTGSCKECIARVISGETKMLGQENINDLDKNQTLLCCTYPTSKEIKIEI